MQHVTVQEDPNQHIAVWHIAYCTKQYNKTKCNVRQWNAMQCDTIQLLYDVMHYSESSDMILNDLIQY